MKNLIEQFKSLFKSKEKIEKERRELARKQQAEKEQAEIARRQAELEWAEFVRKQQAEKEQAEIARIARKKKYDIIIQNWKQNQVFATEMSKISSSQNFNGRGCPLYLEGMCLARVIGQNDSSMGPEPCSMHDAGYKYCELFQMFGHRA